jgi:NADP-reducing hydrogenase subunit HndB
VLTQTGCVGLCGHEPIVEVAVGGAPKVAYRKVDPEMVKRIVREHILEGKTIQEFVIENTPFPTI